MRPVVLSAAFALLAGCGGAASPAEALPFLDGTWTARTDGFQTVEAWRPVADGILLGSGHVTSPEGHLIFSETMAVVPHGGGFALVTWPRGQEPVTFVAEAHDATSVTFRNDAQAFPRVITYRRIDQATLEARATGVEGDGSPREEAWTLTRAPAVPVGPSSPSP